MSTHVKRIPAGKYAFVSDYVRLKALFDHEGIYMDTDVEVVKNLDNRVATAASHATMDSWVWALPGSLCGVDHLRDRAPVHRLLLKERVSGPLS